MRRSNFVLIVGLSFGAACAPRFDVVSIDLGAVPMSEIDRTLEVVRPSSQTLSGEEVNVPAMPARNVLVGSGERFAKEAVEVARKNQERAFKQALAELKDAYIADAKSGAREELLKLTRDYEGRFKELYADLRTLFEEHAKKVGPLWTKLATLQEFPLRPGKTKVPSEVDFLGRADAKMATEIKKTIDSLDNVYRVEVARRVEGLRQLWRADSTELEARNISAIDAAGTKAELEAKRMVTEVLKGLEDSLIKDIERLPSVSGAKVKVHPLTVPRVDVPEDTGSAWSERERLSRRAGLFARLNGYRLVKSGPGVRDVTKEFLAWDNSQVGR